MADMRASDAAEDAAYVMRGAASILEAMAVWREATDWPEEAFTLLARALGEGAERAERAVADGSKRKPQVVESL